MTKNEAMDYLACCADGLDSDFDEAVELVVAALQVQIEAEKIEPLTLEELREMAQRCEGVYVAHSDGTPVFREQTYCAAVLDFSPSFGSTKMHVHAIYGDRLTFWEDEYGKTWLAYRRKPEDGILHGKENS